MHRAPCPPRRIRSRLLVVGLPLVLGASGCATRAHAPRDPVAPSTSVAPAPSSAPSTASSETPTASANVPRVDRCVPCGHEGNTASAPFGQRLGGAVAEGFTRGMVEGFLNAVWK